MKFDWILFDADETLFHFDAYQGLTRMFATWGVDFSREDFFTFREINQPLWIAYQQGEIDALTLKRTRFLSWAERLETTPEQLNRDYLLHMADISTLLPHAKSMLDALRGKVKLGIITNGFEDMQASRLAKHGLSDYFEQVVISEQVGVAKPDPRIFEVAYQATHQPEKKRILMVGDTPESDIIGAQQFGFQTCWLNTKQATLPSGIRCDYEITDLSQLQEIVYSE